MAELNSLEELGSVQEAQPEAPVHVQKLDQYGRAYATGKRKDAIARVWVKPGSGRITVNDWSGDANLTTSNGRIMVSNLAGELTARTSNGRVQVDDLDGPAEVRTSNGRIVLTLAPDQSGPLENVAGDRVTGIRVARGNGAYLSGGSVLVPHPDGGPRPGQAARTVS
jgi:hypothetical protein